MTDMTDGPEVADVRPDDFVPSRTIGDYKNFLKLPIDEARLDAWAKGRASQLGMNRPGLTVWLVQQCHNGKELSNTEQRRLAVICGAPDGTARDG